MTTKATNSVLNLVSPPIDNMVLSQGTLDNVVIGQTTPNTGKFTAITDTGIASPLVGAPTGLLVGIGLSSDFTIVGSTLTLTHPPLPPAGKTIWVRVDGNDSHDGSANDTAHAFATITGALTYIRSNFILSSTSTVVLRLGQNGTYAGPIGSWPPGSWTLVGNSGNPADYVITGGLTQDIITVSGASVLSVSAVTFTNQANLQNWLSAAFGGTLIVNNIIMACTVTNNIFGIFAAFPGGSINIGNATIECNAGTCFAAHDGNITISGSNNATVTFLGGPAFSNATAEAFDLGYIILGIVTMSGVASGTRFIAATNGVINVEGQGINILPGTAPGFTSTGGYYSP